MRRSLNLMLVKTGVDGATTGMAANLPGLKYTAKHANFMLKQVKTWINPNQYCLNPYCITDDPTGLDEDFEIIPAPFEGYWNKPFLFTDGMPSGLSLYMDLDQLITGDLTSTINDCFTMPSDMVACYADHIHWLGVKFGSAMMIYRGGGLVDIGNKYLKEQPWLDKEEIGGDQIWLGKAIAQSRVRYIDDQQPKWAQSYRLQLKGKQPGRNTMIVNFHGRPKYWQCQDKWIRRLLKSYNCDFS